MIRKFLPYFIGICVLAYLVKQATGDGDFKVFLEAAKLVNSGENPYQKWIYIKEGHSCLYFYSPLWAVLLIPFTHLPNFIPNLIWLLFNVWCLYRIGKLLVHYLDLELVSERQLQWILTLTFLLNLRFILYNFSLIQLTIFLLWGSLESIRLFREQKYIRGGMLLALIINIKILPIVLLPYLLYRNEWKSFVSCLLFLVVFLFLPAVIIGWDFNTLLYQSWWGTINPSNEEHLLETGLGPHSLTALIPTLLTPTIGEINLPRNILSLSESSAILVMNCIRLCLVSLTIYFLRWPPFKNAGSRMKELYELSYLFLLVPLVFPHQQKYAFVFMIPAVFYTSAFMVCLYESDDKSTKKLFQWLRFPAMLFFVCTTLTTDGLIGKELNQISQHFKIVTYGALVLILLLVICRPTLFTISTTRKKTS